jgi:phage terminase large subunit
MRIVDLDLLPRQAELIESTARFRAYVGGLGSGKTRIGAIDAVLATMRTRGAQTLVTANTYRQLKRPVIPALLEAFKALGVRASYSREDATFSLKGKRAIVLRSVSNPEDLRGDEFGYWWGDEVRDYGQTAIDTVLGRIGRTKPARWLITTTPCGYDDVWTMFEHAPTPEHVLFRARTRDNVYLDPSYETDLRRKYKGQPELVEQELEGRFTSLGGRRCYPSFDPRKHGTARTYQGVDPATQTWNPLYLTFDFNVTPFVCLAVQETGPSAARTVFVVDEIVRHNSSLEDMAREILKRFGTHRGTLTLNGDSMETRRNVQSGKTSYAILGEYLEALRPQIDVPKKSPDPIERVNAVNYLFAHDRAFVNTERCPVLTEDLQRVSWIRKTGQIDKTNLELTHASDGFGYRCWLEHRPQVFRGEVESLARLPW